MVVNYIKLKDYAKHMNINSGDTVFISSDAKKLLRDAISNHEKPDLNLFIDGLIDAVGKEGTVIFPTFNWDFCSGKTFDYRTTPCKTGSLGTLALKRDGFRRTKHPIYSFAVWGKHQNDLCNLENKESFGSDSPFAFFKKRNVKNYLINVSLKHSFTFTHFAEQHSGVVKHRYIKDFTANYIDEYGNETLRTYSIFVRDLDLDVQTTVDPIESDFIDQGAEKKFSINRSEIKLIYLGMAYDILIKDIVKNRSRKLCTYIGQENC